MRFITSFYIGGKLHQLAEDIQTVLSAGSQTWSLKFSLSASPTDGSSTTINMLLSFAPAFMSLEFGPIPWGPGTAVSARQVAGWWIWPRPHCWTVSCPLHSSFAKRPSKPFSTWLCLLFPPVSRCYSLFMHLPVDTSAWSFLLLRIYIYNDSHLLRSYEPWPSGRQHCIDLDWGLNLGSFT